MLSRTTMLLKQEMLSSRWVGSLPSDSRVQLNHHVCTQQVRLRYQLQRPEGRTSKQSCKPDLCSQSKTEVKGAPADHPPPLLESEHPLSQFSFRTPAQCLVVQHGLCRRHAKGHNGDPARLAAAGSEAMYPCEPRPRQESLFSEIILENEIWESPLSKKMVF